MSGITDIINLISNSEKLNIALNQSSVQNLNGSIKAFFICRLLLSKNTSVCVITPSPDELSEDVSAWLEVKSFAGGIKFYNLSDEMGLNSGLAELIEPSEKNSIFITSPRKDLPAPDSLKQMMMVCLKDKPVNIVGKFLSMEKLPDKLVEFGFTRTDTVDEPLQFASRGGIIDLWPCGRIYPIRLEFGGDEIISIREFEPLQQVSISKLNKLVILPRNISGSSGIEKYFGPVGIVVSDGIRNTEEHRYGHGKTPMYQSIYLGDGFPVDCLPSYQGTLEIFRKTINNLKDYNRFVLCENEAESGRIASLFPEVETRLSKLSRGFILQDVKLAVFTYSDIFGQKHKVKFYHPFKGKGSPIQNLQSLQVNDFVVHIDYGIGLYQGIKKLRVSAQDKEDVETDCLLITYKNGDLYVPIEKFNCIEKWVGDTNRHPELTDLGTNTWERRKSRARKAIHDLTTELLSLYAERKLISGYKFSKDTLWQAELESNFPYEETPDQLKALSEIKNDMESGVSMERLVCGEVGYGKTELALRAAFKAVMDNKQAVILCPTTILVEQHYRTFKLRLQSFPLEVAHLSRFQTSKQQKKIIENIKLGKVDIVIGTHRLLSKEVGFKDLGLLVIDEEHRFGVSQKEKLKKIEKGVDTLSLTATPIPRTLYMALTSIKNLSQLETPPVGRQSVITQVAKFDDLVIKNAIEYELGRGGQVYFVHNRIHSIYAMASFLKRISPDFKIGIAHSELPEKELELVMLRFLQREINILLTTTIIGSGIDIPNSNTIIINRADMFGLADLHQLRGRVGRSTERAYCWLLIPKKVTQDARKRLNAIAAFSELGAGFKLALHDLEFRGAGNLLGGEQHGHIYSIGYKLYERLLEEEVNRLKGKEIKKIIEPEIRLSVSCYIPESYAPAEQKFLLYKRIANITNFEEIKEFEIELLDRFGAMPVEVKNLLEITSIKIVAIEKSIKRIASKDDDVILKFVNPPAKKFLSNPYIKEIKYAENGLEVVLTKVTNLRKLKKLLETI